MTFNITMVVIIIATTIIIIIIVVVNIVIVNIVIELSDVGGQVGGSRGRSQSNATYHPSFQLQKHPHHHHHHHHPFKDQSITIKTYD